MDIQYHGANCITLSNKNLRIVVDDNLKQLGGRALCKPGDILLRTSHTVVDQEPVSPKIVIDTPGEYEVSEVFVYGIAARAHTDEDGLQNTTMYKIVASDLKILVTGHIYPELSDHQLEQIGMIDVMVVPVGGHGYTLDGLGAMKMIKMVEPKRVVPVHYHDETLKYPVPQQTLEDVLKVITIEVSETSHRLKLKTADITDPVKVVVLERS